MNNGILVVLYDICCSFTFSIIFFFYRVFFIKGQIRISCKMLKILLFRCDSISRPDLWDALVPIVLKLINFEDLKLKVEDWKDLSVWQFDTDTTLQHLHLIISNYEICKTFKIFFTWNTTKPESLRSESFKHLNSESLKHLNAEMMLDLIDKF